MKLFVFCMHAESMCCIRRIMCIDAWNMLHAVVDLHTLHTECIPRVLVLVRNYFGRLLKLCMRVGRLHFAGWAGFML